MFALLEPTATYQLGTATDEPDSERWLTASERSLHDRIADPARRRDWRVARLAAKRAVSMATGVAALEQIEIRSAGTALSAAIVDGDTVLGSPRLTVVLSPRGERAAAVAVPGGRRVGIDLERLGSVRPEHLHYLLTPAERRALGYYAPAELWALKEAAWKALTLDDTIVFGALELAFDRAAAPRAASLYGTTYPIHVVVWHPWPGYVLAIVWRVADGDAHP